MIDSTSTSGSGINLNSFDAFQENLIPNKRIAELKHGDKNLNLCVILVQLKSKNKLKNDVRITQYQVADESGSIMCNFYDDVGLRLNEGDILFLKGSYASIFKGHLILYTSKPGFGEVIKMGEYFMTYNDLPNLSLQTWVEKDDEKSGQRSYVVQE
jgi:hypothetical protein